MSNGQDPWQPSGPPRRNPPYGQGGSQHGEGGPRYESGGGPRYGAPRDPRRAPDAYPADPHRTSQQPWTPADQSAQSEPQEPRTRSRSGSRRAAGTGARPAGAAASTGPCRVNEDLDLDEIDPAGRARRRAAKATARRGSTRRKRVVRYTAWATAGTVLAVGGVGFYVVHKMLGNIATVSLGDLKHRPAASKANAQGQTPLNILVLGSQTRDGQTQAVHVGNSTKDGTDLSDTAFLVHISADRKWTEVISIPRDLFVPIPACQDRLDPSITHPAQAEAQFYDAMGEGGPACAVATVEQMTNIRIDHFVELTFDAFIDLTDAVGGVQICVPEPGIDDPNYSGLVLSAGLHTVEGNEALAFVRDRHGLAGGMDTSRIQMQQQFMTALFNKLTANGTLEDPLTLYKIANAVTSNITVDTGLDNISTMASIAESVGTINKKYMQYITAPYTLDAPGEYAYDESGSHSSPGPGFQELWSYMRNDQPLPGSPAAAQFGAAATPTASAKTAAKPTVSASPTVPLSLLTVQVFNGTDITGEAADAAANLKAMGMTTSIGYSGYSGYNTTTVLYPSGDQAKADALANQIAGSVVKQSANVSELTLVIGANAPSVIVATPAAGGSGNATSASTSPSPTATISVEARSGSENICSNLPAGQYGGAPSD
jgi:LCP family protein required for cell wall assembly